MNNFFRKLKAMAGFKEGGIMHDYSQHRYSSRVEYDDKGCTIVASVDDGPEHRFPIYESFGAVDDSRAFRILPSDPLPTIEGEVATSRQIAPRPESVSGVHSTAFNKIAAGLNDAIEIAEKAKGINPKDLIGNTKIDLSVIPPAAELHMAQAMMDGARKYGAFNWRENPVLARVYVAAARRHLLQYLDGENEDPISGVHHLGHAMACCAIILDALETGNLADNRPLPGKAGDLIRSFTPKAAGTA